MTKKTKFRKKTRGRITSTTAKSIRTSASQARVAAPKKTEEMETTLAEEYRYVITDLKRIGILAAAMFGLLVVFALILR